MRDRKWRLSLQVAGKLSQPDPLPPHSRTFPILHLHTHTHTLCARRTPADVVHVVRVVRLPIQQRLHSRSVYAPIPAAVLLLLLLILCRPPPDAA